MSRSSYRSSSPSAGSLILLCAVLSAPAAAAQQVPIPVSPAVQQLYVRDLESWAKMVERVASAPCQDDVKPQRDALVAAAREDITRVQGLVREGDCAAVQDAYLSTFARITSLYNLLRRRTERELGTPFYPVDLLPETFVCGNGTRDGSKLVLRLASNTPIDTVPQRKQAGRLVCEPTKSEAMYELRFEPDHADVDEVVVDIVPKGVAPSEPWARRGRGQVASFRIVRAPEPPRAMQFFKSRPSDYAGEATCELLDGITCILKGLTVEMPAKGETWANFTSAVADPAVKTVRIVADHLIVGAEIRLPGKRLEVFARLVDFRKGGCFVTTPNAEEEKWKPAAAGSCTDTSPKIAPKNGSNGGDALVLVAQVTTQIPNAVVFDLQGAKGQSVEGGWGRLEDRRLDGTILPTFNRTYDAPNKAGEKEKRKPYAFVDTAGHRYEIVLQAGDTIKGDWLNDDNRKAWEDAIFPSTATEGALQPKMKKGAYVLQDGMPTFEEGEVRPFWPGDGKNAIAAPPPGKGGNGGVITTTLPWVGTNLNPGRNGDCGKVAKGGAAGTPRYAMHVRHYTDLKHGTEVKHGQVIPYDYRSYKEASHIWDGIEHLHVSRDGRDAEGKEQKESGRPGREEKAATDLWAATELTDFVAKEADRAYLMGRVELARFLVKTYGPVVRRISAKPPSALAGYMTSEAARLSRHAIALESMERRLALGLDYFGNPPGWMPRASLAWHTGVYDQELECALSMLHYAGVVKNNDIVLKQRVRAMGQLRESTETAVTQCADDISGLYDRMKELGSESGEVADKLARTHSTLATLTREIMAEAKDTVKARRERDRFLGVLKGVSSVLACVPHPVAQGAAVALNGVVALSSADDVGDFMKGLKGVADDWKALSKTSNSWDESEWGKKVKAWSETSDRTEKLKTAYDTVKSLYGQLETVDAALAPVRVRAGDKEVQQEFERLAGEDPRFQGLADSVSNLGEEMRGIAVMAEEVEGGLVALTSRMDELLRDRDTLAHELSQTEMTVVSDGSMRAITALEEDAARRLDRSRYLLSKSFEYETMESGWGKGGDVMNSLREGLQSALMPGGGAAGVGVAEAVKQAVKDAYRSELRRMGELAVERFRSGQPMSGSFDLTLNAMELAELNQSREVIIDPVRLMMEVEAGRVNPKITGFEVRERRLADGSDRVVKLRVSLAGPARFTASTDPVGYVWFQREGSNHEAWFQWNWEGRVDDRVMTTGTAHDDDLARLFAGSSLPQGVGLIGRPGLCGALRIARVDMNSEHPLASLVLKVSYDCEDVGEVGLQPIGAHVLAAYDPRWLGSGARADDVAALVNLHPRIHWRALGAAGEEVASGREQGSWMADVPRAKTKSVRLIAERRVGPMVFAGWYRRRDELSPPGPVQPGDWRCCVGDKLSGSQTIDLPIEDGGKWVMAYAV